MSLAMPGYGKCSFLQWLLGYLPEPWLLSNNGSYWLLTQIPRSYSKKLQRVSVQSLCLLLTFSKRVILLSSCYLVKKKKLPGRFWTETFHLLLPLCLLTLKWEQGRHFSPSRHGKRARVARRTWSLVLPFLQSPRALLSLHLQLALCALEDPGRGESSVDPQPLINLPPALSHFTARAAAPWLSGRCLIKWQEAGVDLLSQSSWEEREDGGGWGLGWELQGEMRRRQSLELWGFGWGHLQVTYTDRLKIHCSLEMCIYNMVIWRGLRETVPSVQGCFRP